MSDRAKRREEMRLEVGSKEKSLRIIPETPFDASYLRDFFGGGGPLDSWDFLKDTKREAKIRVVGVGQSTNYVEIMVCNK